MATVTGLTAERMLAIEAASVIDGDVVGDNLILTTKGGTQIDAGSVRGPKGDQGPVGSDLKVLESIPILNVGLVGQIRAGRQLTAADFTDMGLNPPLGLWNLSDLSDASGNGRALSNKGAVSFAPGINGLATTAAQFVGSAAQALYISDTGAADALRIKTGSWGCWFKASKRGIDQCMMGKFTLASGAGRVWLLNVGSNNIAYGQATYDTAGSSLSITGVSDVVDDRWHFVVVTVDGSHGRIYVDGILEGMQLLSGMLNNTSAAATNIGGYNADAATASVGSFYGRIDEAFITSDVLSEDQIRMLYCVKLPHTLGVVPTRLNLNVRRLRKGAALVAADFPTQPLRLHNFSGGSLGDEGSHNLPLTNSGGSLNVSGVDGGSGNAYNLAGNPQWLNSADTGLPSGAATRSFGCWFKTTLMSNGHLIVWGTTHGASDTRLVVSGSGTLVWAEAPAPGDSVSGPFVSDGQWHHAVAVYDSTLTEGKRKLYLDGKLVGSSNNVGAPILGGANKFRIGVSLAGSEWYTGQIDGVFVCSTALSLETILRLYNKASQTLSPSPKNVGDHVEGMTATDILATFDTLESQHQIDLSVAA